jgi:Predicted RNA-binding protein homologous to eukaryotic snRNP
MALDGALLRHIKKELEEKLVGGRVDKIHQPGKDEMVVAIRTREGLHRLLFSVRADSARVALIGESLENPKQPPMLCMLLRKRLSGARLMLISQPGLERVLQFEFDAVNELGDRVRLQLIVEIMGKYSNVILVNEEGKVVDALKRVDIEMSSKRLVLPGVTYQLPPGQDKLNIMETEPETLIEKMDELPKNMELSKALLTLLQGLSPIVCREIQHQIGKDREVYTKEMDDELRFRLKYFYRQLRDCIISVSGKPIMAINRQGKPMDFSFMEIHQYGTSAVTAEKEAFSIMLETFYREKDSVERMRVREQDLLKLLSNMSERLHRKIEAQQAELVTCADRDSFRIMADLLNANLYIIQKGAEQIELVNFYDENSTMLKIPLDKMLTPSQNAQRYYKEYRKAKTAEIKLQEQIKIAREELAYIESVFEALALAKSEQDLSEIRAELAEEGYVRIPKSKKAKVPAVSPPMSFQVADGYTVLVGRNNRQNDKLTMKTAKNYDIWFHTKNIPGSHTVLLTDGKEPTEAAMEQAAALAARHSKAKNSAQVPVDYTQIRNVSKPQGAKPGFVIYVNYKTMYVDPQAEI